MFTGGSSESRENATSAGSSRHVDGEPQPFQSRSRTSRSGPHVKELFMKAKRHLSWGSLALALVGSCVTSPMAVNADPPNGGPPREGNCDQAGDLFPDNNPGPGSLKEIPVPEPTNLGSYVRRRDVAIALGKAFFWDMQVGSDGVQACASCHFRGGADPRSVNQLNPGGQDNPDPTIDLGGPNYQLKRSDFPLHLLADPTDRTSVVRRSLDDVVSSQGVHLRQFVRAERGAIRDETLVMPDPVFNLRGVNTRRAEPRNTPTVINAALTLQNFWDRRAENTFNGVSVHGAGDSAARVLRADGAGRITPVVVRIDNASLASQAVGPPLSDREMGSVGRTFKDIGKRLASARPLRQQRVAVDDSVLAPYVDHRKHRRGLDRTYRQLIERAFDPAWWKSSSIVRVESNGSLAFVPRPNRPLLDGEYTMLEHNFALFFGLSVQLYEMTLISDDAPIDRFFEGQENALTAKERRGLDIFNSESADTACFACHSGAELTDNSRRILDGAVVDDVKQPAEWSERMFNGACEVVAYDQGMYNIGVAPTEEDLGGGSNDPFGNPLSFIKLLTLPASAIPSGELLTYPIPNIANPPFAIGERTVTDGTFKVPSLRNLQLTAPYFHNGGQRTIRQVVEFYNRGGDFREHNVQNIDFEIGKLNLTPQQIDELVAFLGRPLTDLRVVKQSAPFDHPQLFVPNGHVADGDVPRANEEGVARDVLLEIPEVGRHGGRLPDGFLE
jgi:cytochrome c peroxidase